MKVAKFKKIYKFISEINDLDVNPRNLLNFSDADVELIINSMDEVTKSVEQLIKFLDWEQDNKDWKEQFSHLEGIENFDIRSYLIDRILTASSDETADNIYSYFDFDSVSETLKNSMKTVEEWKTYIESIGGTMDGEHVARNLETVLEFCENNRCEMIKKIMYYSQAGDIDSQSLKEYFSEDILQKYLAEILDLLILDYDIDELQTFFSRWNDAVLETKVLPQNTTYQQVYDYLKNSSLFSHLANNSGLVSIFTNASETNYPEILSLFELVESKKDKEVFDMLVDTEIALESSSLRNYITEIVEHKDDDSDYRMSLMHLLDKGKIHRNTNFIDMVIRLLGKTQNIDRNSMEMADFISSVGPIEVLNDIEINDKNLVTRQLIYDEFPKLLENRQLSDNEKSYYKDWLKRLSQLPRNVAQKILAIINLESVKQMSLESNEKLKEVLLDKDNFGSLDYIYGQYLDKEKQYQSYKEYKEVEEKSKVTPPQPLPNNEEVQLLTVVELLERQFDFDLVLDGFGDEEDITTKTLIRSLAYKNNQNK